MNSPLGILKSLSPVPKWVPSVYAGLCLILYGTPLTRILHAESAAIIAGAAWFVAGLSSLTLFARDVPFRRTLTTQLAVLTVPWLFLTLSLVVAANCGYWQGLLLYLVFAPPSVALSVAIAYALAATRIHCKKMALVAVGLAIAVSGCLYDLALHPQFYVYNHVFGGVLGPVYDEELALRRGIFTFRGLTLIWAAFAWQIGRRLRGMHIPRAAIASTVATTGLAYTFSVTLGFNTSYRHIERTLSGHVRTEHFDIRYDPESLELDDVRRLAGDHEYRYAELARRLNTEVSDRIVTYLFPDSDTKARLTGARTTNVAPVWLRRPQVHVLATHYDLVFPHELAHVFSREFGLPILRASWSAGLIEGLAVALEPPDGLPTAHQQMAALAMAEPGIGDRLSRRLSPIGFWTGRGAVSYVATGSFVGYLLHAYGLERLRRVYASGNFASIYGKSAKELAGEWERYVLSLPVMDRGTGDWISGRFAVESLFEMRCPHYIPRFVRLHESGVQALEQQDTTRAEALLLHAIQLEPTFEPALMEWTRIATATGNADKVVERLGESVSIHRSAGLSVRLGDALAALGRDHEALTAYSDALDLLPSYAREAAALIQLRRALTTHPGASQIVRAGRTADDFVAFDTKEAHLFAAVLHASHDEYEQALHLLRTTPVPVLSPFFLPRLAWLSRWSSHRGDLREAAYFAREAARHFEAAGAFNEAAAHRDRAAKADWLLAMQ